MEWPAILFPLIVVKFAMQTNFYLRNNICIYKKKFHHLVSIYCRLNIWIYKNFIAREALRKSSSRIWESNRMDKMPKNGRKKLFEGSFQHILMLNRPLC